MRSKADSPTLQCTASGCDRPLRARGLCSTHYNQTKPTRHAPQQYSCVVCGTKVWRGVKTDRRHVCSPKCWKTLTGCEGSYDRTLDAASRARQLGSPVVEVFSVESIFDRDNWCCYLCGEPVERNVAYFHPLAPTIDHVIPLSKGGHHTPANTRCAHLACNSSKRDLPAQAA